VPTQDSAYEQLLWEFNKRTDALNYHIREQQRLEKLIAKLKAKLAKADGKKKR
jgi:hypothetical protein